MAPTNPQPAAERRKERRHWSIPIAPRPRQPELLDVLGTADDSEPEELRARRESLAHELWSALRGTLRWAVYPPERRDELARQRHFRHAERRALARAEAPELARALVVFEGLALTPGVVKDRDVALAAKRVAEWAHLRGFNETALQFAEAAAAVQPRDPGWANLAGRMNREATEPERAWLWYERAVGLSRKRAGGLDRRRQRKYLAEYSTAHRGLGTLHSEVGEYAEARKCYNSAAWAAREAGLKWLAAQTDHWLLLMYAEVGEFNRAEFHASRALERYPKNHERIPALVHDFGFLLVRRGLFSLALPLLTQVLRAPIPVVEQVIGWSTVARCAGALRDRGVYTNAKAQVLALAPVHELYAPTAMLNLGFGATALGDWTDAEGFTRAGLESASARSLHDVERIGLALLQNIVERHMPVELVPAKSAGSRALQALISSMQDRLLAWQGPDWRGGQSGVKDAPPV